ncbi:ATP-binding protein [Fulvivirga sp. M361]|uniref:AAA family ATPase n=1 Tax=Fulvivirga sp. M361 TaxID=2594266 RepID=UPI001179A50E|nr:ATP-binding protein [Fulvivirga sp. M361]TRX59387.1 ATP-binding protein [Fulvivirga sp. M361]
MRKPTNPFVLSGYHSPEYFCDREKELDWLIEQFNNERNTVLYAWRRTGKTALIKHFFYQLEKVKKAEGVFVDLLGTTDLADANKRIASEIVQRFGSLNTGIGTALMKLIGSVGATFGIDPLNGTPQITFGMVGPHSVPGSLEAIGKFLSERKKPVIICIDEFQQIVNYPEKHAEATFRTWVQAYPMVRFVFSGSHRHMMQSMFSEKSRPFYRSAQLLPLDTLPQPVYLNFITEHFEKAGKSIDPLHFNKIFDWTRMQTYYVQLVCNKLYGRTDHVDNGLLGEVFHEIIQQEVPLFSSYQQLFTHFQWKLLGALAKAETVENPLGQSFLQQYALGAASSVSTALKTLIKKEFIIQTGSNYTLHDTLLMRWLQQM